MMRRSLVLAALGAGLFAAPTASARAPRPLKWPRPTIKSVLPGPGHITIQLDRISHTLKPHQQAPTHIKMHPKAAGKLPSTVRVIFQTRVIRTRKRITYAILQVAINAAPKPSARRLERVRPAQDIGDFIDLVWSRAAEQADEQNGTTKLGIGFVDDWIRAVNADQLALEQLHQIFGAIDDDAKAAGSAPATGHYDDGHGFSWKAAGVRDSFNDLTKTAAARLAYEDLTRHIEEDLAADVDGDGDKGPPACGQSSASASLIQITSPGPQKVASYFMETKIPFWDYWRHRGFAAGGCNFDDGSSQVNIDIYDGDRLVAWQHDFPPYPTPPDSDQPAMGHGGETCTETFMTENGTPYTKNLCTVGHPILGIPPPSEGYLETGWPQDPATTPHFAIVFQVEGSEAGHTAFLKGSVSWRPKP
jgi:hypothetical protein